MASLPVIKCRPPKPDDRLQPDDYILINGDVFYPLIASVRGRQVSIEFVKEKKEKQAYFGKLRWYKVLSWAKNGKATLLPLMETASGYVHSSDGNYAIPGDLEVDMSLPIEDRDPNQVLPPFSDRISDCLEAIRDDSKFEALKSTTTENGSTGDIKLSLVQEQSSRDVGISVQNDICPCASNRLDKIPIEVFIEIARWLDPASQRSLKAVSERSNIVYGRVLCVKAILFENNPSWVVRNVKICDPEEGDLDVCCHKGTFPPCLSCYGGPKVGPNE
jgi:hypothetical protein